MPHSPKIATCCYCGARAALVLKGTARHELACSNCGAPLHELKMMPSDRRGERELVKPSTMRPGLYDKGRRPSKGKSYKRKKKSRSKRIFEEIWDIAEDVFDIFD